MSGPGPHVLVLRALGLGDLCTAVPALRGLRRAFPGHRLVLAAPAWQREIAVRVGVDELVAVDGLVPLPPELSGVDVAVNLHGRGPQSSQLLAQLDPGRLVAFSHDGVAAAAGGPEWRDDEHEVRRWCRLLAEYGVPADPADLHLPPPATRSPVAPGSVVVHPGAASAGRRWPADRYARVVEHLLQLGHPVAVTGSADEARLCRDVARAVRTDGELHVLAGRTSLSELAAAVAAAGLVLTNDTGVGHLATAYATPSVLLFGPTPPSMWGPPPDGPHEVIWKGLVGDPHSGSVHEGLLAIGVDEVLAAIDRVGARVPA